MFVCCGILNNHESERRGTQFVTRKISLGVARIAQGITTHIRLGNMLARRDWGYSPDYTDAMWRMLQQDTPDDYVVATGITHSVADFAKAAFLAANIDNWENCVNYDAQYDRPLDIYTLCGDASKAKAVLGWTPTTTFEQMVEIMVKHDLEQA
jgi:GDPmannose 4,6-dehydratase